MRSDAPEGDATEINIHTQSALSHTRATLTKGKRRCILKPGNVREEDRLSRRGWVSHLYGSRLLSMLLQLRRLVFTLAPVCSLLVLRVGVPPRTHEQRD